MHQNVRPFFTAPCRDRNFVSYGRSFVSDFLPLASSRASKSLASVFEKNFNHFEGQRSQRRRNRVRTGVSRSFLSRRDRSRGKKGIIGGWLKPARSKARQTGPNVTAFATHGLPEFAFGANCHLALENCCFAIGAHWQGIAAFTN